MTLNVPATYAASGECVCVYAQLFPMVEKNPPRIEICVSSGSSSSSFGSQLVNSHICKRAINARDATRLFVCNYILVDACFGFGFEPFEPTTTVRIFFFSVAATVWRHTSHRCDCTVHARHRKTLGCAWAWGRRQYAQPHNKSLVRFVAANSFVLYSPRFVAFFPRNCVLIWIKCILMMMGGVDGIALNFGMCDAAVMFEIKWRKNVTDFAVGKSWFSVQTTIYANRSIFSAVKIAMIWDFQFGKWQTADTEGVWPGDMTPRCGCSPRRTARFFFFFSISKTQFPCSRVSCQAIRTLDTRLCN